MRNLFLISTKGLIGTYIRTQPYRSNECVTRLDAVAMSVKQ